MTGDTRAFAPKMFEDKDEKYEIFFYLLIIVNVESEFELKV